MMYSEFIEMSGNSENYISFKEYTEDIEPIYMDCNLSKQEFIKFYKDTFERMVYPIIKNTIRRLSLEEKLAYIHGENPEFENHIKLVDLYARRLAYQYMALYLGTKGVGTV